MRVTLAYELPAAVVGSGYDLLLQQQPGVPRGHVSVSVGEAHALIENSPGQFAHWRLDSTDAPLLRDQPLPAAPITGCGMAPVLAQPLAPPEWVQIPSAEIDAAVVALGVEPTGEMEPPPTPDVVRWYRMSSRPGQPGNSVMSGHVDWGGRPAVFWGLRALRAGDPILVRGTDGVTHTYTVDWNETYTWQDAPLDRIVGPSEESLLTLITCDGVFDPASRRYSDRRVVRAHLVD